MDINEAIDKYYFPLSATQFIQMGKEFATSFRSSLNEILDDNNGVEIELYINLNAKIRIYLMIRGKNGNTFINVTSSKLIYSTNPSVNSIRVALNSDNNLLFNTAFVLGQNGYLIDNMGTERNVQYMANNTNPSGPYNLFIVLLPSLTLQDMINNYIENVEKLRKQGHRINVPTLEVIAGIRLKQSSRPINIVPQHDNLGNSNIPEQDIEPYRPNIRITEGEATPEDMGESINVIIRNEEVVNAVEPEEEDEIIISTVPNAASVSDITNTIIDILSAEVMAKGSNGPNPSDYIPIGGNYNGDAVPNLLSKGYNLGKSLLGIILPRLPLRYHDGRYNYYTVLSIIGGLSILPLSVLYWYTDLIKRDMQVTTEFMQSVLNNKVEINNTQDVVNQYIEYIETTPKLSPNDKDLLTPLLKNTVIYHSQDGSFISIPETMQSLDENGVKLGPYFPEKYADNLPTPIITPSYKFSPTPSQIISPSASMFPSASPRFTPSDMYNMGDKYVPTQLEETIDSVIGALPSLPPATWVGSVLPIFGSLLGNGLSVLSTIASAGISIISYIIIGALAVGAYFISRK